MTYSQALNKAAALCSQSERCPYDIRQKVLGWGLAEDDADRLIDYLTREGYLDEARFTRAFVSDKFRFERWGRVKIRYALRGKGISDTLIDMAMDDAIDADDYQQACSDLLRQRMRGMSMPLSQADRARLFRFAAQRGFESSVIARAIS